MSRLWDKLRSVKDTNGRDIMIFVMSLLLAFSIWLIHNLSLYYNEEVSVPIRARSNIPGRAQLSSNDAIVQARLRLTPVGRCIASQFWWISPRWTCIPAPVRCSTLPGRT